MLSSLKMAPEVTPSPEDLPCSESSQSQEGLDPDQAAIADQNIVAVELYDDEVPNDNDENNFIDVNNGYTALGQFSSDDEDDNSDDDACDNTNDGEDDKPLRDDSMPYIDNIPGPGSLQNDASGTLDDLALFGATHLTDASASSDTISCSPVQVHIIGISHCLL